jgi:hypothetical protein
LRDAGVSAELLEISGETHISEIRSLSRDGDSTAEAMLRFMKR